ncbi:MAG: hypothetical protein RIC55_28370 [Pirellulaceae bacterium]
MTDSNRTNAAGKAAEKPSKPYPEFPLYAHNSGHWAKKIRGKTHFFGAWGKRIDGKLTRLEDLGWEAALEEYKRVADDLHAGKTPRVQAEGLEVAELCDRFIVAKEALRDNGEISPRTWQAYKSTTDRIVRVFGKKRLVVDLSADDFGILRSDIAKKRGHVALGNEIQRVRTIFKFGFDEGLIDRPVRYGQQFKKPSKTALRKAKAANGEKMLEPAALRELIDAATPQLKAMILLGLNCGLGNTDCSSLPDSALDLEGGWLTYPREKTGVARRAKLWPETTTALQVVIDNRATPKSKADAGLVFVTKYGQRWVKLSTKGTPADAITQQFRKLLDETKHHRAGIGFYVLRHVFRTVADATRDFPAVRLVMGHTDSSIDNEYRERIDDDRLEAVADHVHAWLFADDKKGGRKATKKAAKTKTKRTAKKNSQPISNRSPEVSVAYDRDGERVSKTFADPYEARRFYVAKEKAGANPEVAQPRLRIVG